MDDHCPTGDLIDWEAMDHVEEPDDYDPDGWMAAQDRYDRRVYGD